MATFVSKTVVVLFVFLTLSFSFVSQVAAVQQDYAMLLFDNPPYRGIVRVWVQNSPITQDVVAALQYMNGAITAWDAQYPQYAVNVTFTIHVQGNGEASPPAFLGVTDYDPLFVYLTSSAYDIFYVAQSGIQGTGCGVMFPLNRVAYQGAIVMLHKAIIAQSYDATYCPEKYYVPYGTAMHEMSHAVLQLGDLYGGPGPGTWLQEHPIIVGELMDGSGPYNSLSTLDLYGASAQAVLYAKYGVGSDGNSKWPTGMDNHTVYLPDAIPYKFYCSHVGESTECPTTPEVIWANGNTVPEFSAPTALVLVSVLGASLFILRRKERVEKNGL